MTRAGLRRSFLREIMYKLNLRMKKVGKTHTGEKKALRRKNRKKEDVRLGQQKEGF